MFNCNACQRYWSFDEINNHKNEERCVADKKSDNLIEKLAVRAPKQAAGSKVIEDKPKPETRNLFVLTMHDATLTKIEEYITASK